MTKTKRVLNFYISMKIILERRLRVVNGYIRKPRVIILNNLTWEKGKKYLREIKKKGFPSKDENIKTIT